MICLETTKRFCTEYWKIENYDLAMADKTHTWHCHHRHEIDWVLPKEELITIGRYYDVHYSELIFLTPKEHRKLHMRGENNPMYGKVGLNKGKHHTEEWKQKISDSLKGKPKSEEWKQKISDSLKGKANQKMKGNQNSLKYHITAEELYDLYVVQGLSKYRIAKMYGCATQTICDKLKKYNITKNGRH